MSDEVKQNFLSRLLRGRTRPSQSSSSAEARLPEDLSPSARLRFFRKHPDAMRKLLGKGPDFDPIVLGLEWEPPQEKKGQQQTGSVQQETPPDRGKQGPPFAISRDLLKNGHMHLRGRTRSGKSSLAITPLLAQLARPYDVYDADGKNIVQGKFKDAIFVFDLGGDLALFNFARIQARMHGRTFRFLSLEAKDDWDYFDPFQAAGDRKDRLIRTAILLQQAFSLDHGLVYGGSYYSQRNLSALLSVARKLARRNKNSTVRTTLDEVSKYLDQEQVKDADEIRMIFQFLEEYEQLKPPDPMPANVINMANALQHGEIVYFLCPTIGEAMTARQICGLGLYTLINAAMERVRHREKKDRGRPLSHAWVFVDEFQELAGRSYANLLAQASKFGLSLIMANQTTTQLSSRDMNLADIVRDNTFAKIYFTITGEEDIRGMQTFSKESSRFVRGSSSSTHSHDFSLTQQVSSSELLVPTLKTDEILDTSSTDKHCFLILDDGTRHREPIRLWTDYALKRRTFQRFKQTPPRRLKKPREQQPPTDAEEPLWKQARRKLTSTPWQQPLAKLLSLKLDNENPLEV